MKPQTVNPPLFQKAVRIIFCTAFGCTGSRQLQRLSSHVTFGRVSSVVVVIVIIVSPRRRLLPSRPANRFVGRSRQVFAAFAFVVMARRVTLFFQVQH